MKAIVKQKKPKEGPEKSAVKTTDLNKREEIKTDFPLSEKDEIKQAEERLRKAVKRNN
jgi:hypothetical protein